MKKIIFLTSLLLATSISQAQEYGRVISSNPIITQTNVPQQVCSGYSNQTFYENNSQAGLVGALIGGVIGNNLSSRHRGASTVAGAIAGAAIGSQVGGQYRSSPVQNCYTTNVSQNNLVGYDVWYEHRGRRYQTRTSYDPGDFIKINYPRQTVYIVQKPIYVSHPVIVRRGNHGYHREHRRDHRNW